MNHQDFLRSKSLNNIPKNKYLNVLEKLKNNYKAEIAVGRYYESNIQVEYWSLTMEKNFVGDKRLLEKYNSYVNDIKENYLSGKSICFAGFHGIGKTMAASCILKKACEKGYSCLYTTLSDIVSVLTTAPFEDRYLARKELLLCDFVCIDEFDPRFMATENAVDLYARTMETIFRTRSQNKLPTLMCTNSPNVEKSFNGPLKDSISSLMNGYIEVFPIFGEDFRIKKC